MRPTERGHASLSLLNCEQTLSVNNEVISHYYVYVPLAQVMCNM
jgi:hypothetical protein